MAVVEDRAAAAGRRSVVTSPPVLLVGAVGLALTLWRVGIGVYPAWGQAMGLSRALAMRPQNLNPEGEFLLWSPTGMIIMRALDVTDQTPWITWHLAILGVGMILVFAQVRELYGRGAASLAVAAFFACSLPVVLFGWAGSSDPFMWIAASLATLATGPVGAFGAGALLGFSAFEQGFAAMVGLAVLVWSGQWGKVRVMGWVFAGLFAGKVLVELFVRVRLGASHDRRWWAENVLGYDALLEGWWRGMPALLGTVFAAAWLVYLRRMWTARSRWPWAVAWVIPFATTLIAADETRVAALASWPVLLVAAITLDRDEPERSGPTAWALLGLTVLVPAVFVWGGGIQAA